MILPLEEVERTLLANPEREDIFLRNQHAMAKRGNDDVLPKKETRYHKDISEQQNLQRN